MVHLLPLPGSVRFAGSLKSVIDRVVRDAHAIERGGADGLIQGKAFGTLLYCNALKSNVRNCADVFVKHGRLLDQTDFAEAAKDVTERALADAVIVTGSSPGPETSLPDLRNVKAAVPETPAMAGSGILKTNMAHVLKSCDGCVVRTDLKIDGQVHNPVDVNRVKTFTKIRDRINSA